MKTDHHSKDLKDSRNLADHLGLHAPFRSFASRGADARPPPQREDERRKRRRSPSAASSYLEPAIRVDDSDGGSDDLHDATALRASHVTQQSAKIMGKLSRSSSHTLGLPEKPLETYERRKRHKTREDRYEPKQERKRDNVKKREKGAREKPKRKRKHAQKSGSALMQDFAAGNVEPERLTVSLYDHHNGVFVHSVER